MYSSAAGSRQQTPDTDIHSNATAGRTAGRPRERLGPSWVVAQLTQPLEVQTQCPKHPTQIYNTFPPFTEVFSSIFPSASTMVHHIPQQTAPYPNPLGMASGHRQVSPHPPTDPGRLSMGEAPSAPAPAQPAPAPGRRPGQDDPARGQRPGQDDPTPSAEEERRSGPPADGPDGPV